MSKKQLEKIEVFCEICKQARVIARGTYQQVIKRNGFYRCALCSPQRTKKFWEDPNRKLIHGESVKSSIAYQESLPERNKKISGKHNGMFGRTHSPETLKKFSEIRKGKFGKLAPNWRGGKTSFTKRIKSLIQKRYCWFTNVFIRDDFKCVRCDAKNNLDAHHIDPIVKIIARITEGISFENDDLKIEYVIQHPDIMDEKLVNGITLCRACHRKAHSNWGSHVRP